MAKVGFLLATKPNDWNAYLASFRQQLMNGVTVSIQPPGGAGGDANVIRQTAITLANDNTIDIIVTAGTLAALELQAATQANQKPFIYASVGDAKISGLLPQPGGNYTGGSNGQVTYVTQRVAYMLAAKDSAGNPLFVNKFAVVGNYSNEPTKSAMNAAFKELSNKGKQLVPLASSTITPTTNIATFISGLQAQGVKSLYCCSDLWLTVQSTALNNAAHPAMKTMWEIDEQRLIHNADAAYGVSFKTMFQKAADDANQLLSNPGTKAGDLPLFEPGLPSPGKKKKSPAKKKSLAKKKSAAKKKSRAKKRPAKKKARRSR